MRSFAILTWTHTSPKVSHRIHCPGILYKTPISFVRIVACPITHALIFTCMRRLIDTQSTRQRLAQKLAKRSPVYGVAVLSTSATKGRPRHRRPAHLATPLRQFAACAPPEPQYHATHRTPSVMNHPFPPHIHAPALALTGRIASLPPSVRALQSANAVADVAPALCYAPLHSAARPHYCSSHPPPRRCPSPFQHGIYLPSVLPVAIALC